MNSLLKPLRRLHGIIHEKRQYRLMADSLIRSVKKDPRSLVYYVMTPTHGNMGDHAIAISGASQLFNRGIPFRELTINDIFLLQRCRMLRVMNGHPIIINGGGNIGTLWVGEDRRIREIIQACPRSKIICFPSTAYYEPSPDGEKRKKRAKKCFRKHPSLQLFARDEYSFHIFQEMGLDVTLVPDLALLLDKQMPAQKRKGCVICLRSDLERTLDQTQVDAVKKAAQTLFSDSVSESDMNIRQQVMPEDRERVLDEKFMEFRKASLVITDRLHGMIFAAVTATPCIVLDSKSPKVRGCYSWLKQLGYIKLANDPTDIQGLFLQLQLESAHYDSKRFATLFRPLLKALDSLSSES